MRWIRQSLCFHKVHILVGQRNKISGSDKWCKQNSKGMQRVEGIREMLQVRRVSLKRDICSRPWIMRSKEGRQASQVALVAKNPPANAGDPGDVGLIPGSGRSPGRGHGNPLHILAWEIPWTKEPGGLQSTGSQRVRHWSDLSTALHCGRHFTKYTNVKSWFYTWN